jgi:uncharacterized protein (DUF4415 family)
MPVKPKHTTHFRLDPTHPPTLTPEQQAQLEALPIDYSDIPELPDDFWTQHPPVKRANKRLVTLRLDAEVLAFFQKQRRGYQTQINAVLRAYVEAQSREQISFSEPDVRPVSTNVPRKVAPRSETVPSTEEQTHHGADTR